MRMNSTIPMMGQPVNALGRLREGLAAATQANAIGDNNRLRDVFSAQGPGILAGDQNALNALATSGPQGGAMAVDIRQQQEAMAIARERLQMAQAKAAREAQALAAQMSEEERQRTRDAIGRGLATAISVMRDPDIDDAARMDGVNRILRTAGLEAVGSLEDAALVIASYETALPFFEAGQAVMSGGTQQPDYVTINNQLVDRNAQGGPSVVPIQGMPAGGGGSEAEQSIARMVGIGIPREIAIRIEDGVYRVATDPVTRDTVVVDLSTGQQVYRVNPDGGPQPASQPTDGSDPSVPQLGFGNVPQNAENAFGLRGTIGAVGNAVTDFAGLGEVAPEIAENQRFFRTYEEDALVYLAQAYPRQPAQALMERIRSLVPNVGTFEGASRAQGELMALRERFASDLASAEADLGRRLSPSDRAAINSRASALREMLSRTDQAIARFGGGTTQGQNTTRSGVTWEVVE